MENLFDAIYENNILTESFTLQYINDAGDIVARDYFDSFDDAKGLFDSLVDTYERENETEKGLCINDAWGDDLICAEPVKPGRYRIIDYRAPLDESATNMIPAPYAKYFKVTADSSASVAEQLPDYDLIHLAWCAPKGRNADKLINAGLDDVELVVDNDTGSKKLVYVVGDRLFEVAGELDSILNESVNRSAIKVGDIFTIDEGPLGLAKWKIIDININDEALYIPANDVAERVCRQVGEPLTYCPIGDLLKNAEEKDMHDHYMKNADRDRYLHFLDMVLELDHAWGSHFIQGYLRGIEKENANLTDLDTKHLKELFKKLTTGYKAEIKKYGEDSEIPAPIYLYMISSKHLNEGVFRHMADIILCDSWGSEISRTVVEDNSEDIIRGIASLYPQVGDVIKIEAGQHEDNSI